MIAVPVVLTGHQTKILVEEVANVYSYDRLAAYMRTEFERNIETIALNRSTIQDVALAVVDCAVKEAWIGRLLESFTTGPYPSLGRVATLLLQESRPVADLPAGSGGGAAYGADLIWHRPFLDRARLREHMEDLLSESATRVLAVTGERGSGKTFSWVYVTHLRDRLQTFTPVLVDFAEWIGRICTPLDVMTEIAAQLRLSRPTVDRHAQGAAQAQQLRTWLVGELPVTGPSAKWVIVFDSIDHAPLPQETVQLMEYVAGAAILQRHPGLRVVLLGYTNQFPLNFWNVVLTEEIGPIGRPAVCDFLTRLARANAVPITEEAVGLTADHVLQQLEKEPEGAARGLPEVLARAANTVFGKEVL